MSYFYSFRSYAQLICLSLLSPIASVRFSTSSWTAIASYEISTFCTLIFVVVKRPLDYFDFDKFCICRFRKDNYYLNCQYFQHNSWNCYHVIMPFVNVRIVQNFSFLCTYSATFEYNSRGNLSSNHFYYFFSFKNFIICFI